MDVATRKNFLGLPAYEGVEGEVYMNPNQRAYFSAMLKAWCQVLVSDSDDFKTSLQAMEVYVDDIDRASHEESQRMNFRSSERKRKLLKKVTEAMGRLQKGDYGFCKTCGEPVGFSRLEARPTAEECINCKTVSEIYEKRGRE